MRKEVFAVSEFRHLGNSKCKNSEAWEMWGASVWCNIMQTALHKALTTSSVNTAFMNSRSCSVLWKPNFWIDIPGCQIQVSLTSSVKLNIRISSSFNRSRSLRQLFKCANIFEGHCQFFNITIFSLLVRPIPPALQIHRNSDLYSKVFIFCTYGFHAGKSDARINSLLIMLAFTFQHMLMPYFCSQVIYNMMDNFVCF